LTLATSTNNSPCVILNRDGLKIFKISSSDLLSK